MEYIDIMKRGLIFLVLSFFFVTVYAQEWSVGPRAGLNVANITNYSGGWSCFGNAGLFGEWKKDYWALEADVLYSMQGTHFEGSSEKDHYLLVPLKAKYYLPACKGLNVFVGPQLDICLKRNTMKFDGLPSDIPSGQKVDIRTCMLSATFGLGYRFSCGLDLNANYNIGLLSNVKTSGFDSMSNNVFQISVGWCLYKSNK